MNKTTREREREKKLQESAHNTEPCRSAASLYRHLHIYSSSNNNNSNSNSNSNNCHTYRGCRFVVCGVSVW